MVASPFCSEKNKKASSTFLARSLRRFSLDTDALKNRLLPMRPLLLSCCTGTALWVAFCVKALLIASLCLTTQKAATLCCGLHGRPSPFRYAALLSRGGHSRPHPASQGRRWGRRSAVSAGSEQLIFINNKRQKYNRKIWTHFTASTGKQPKK